METFSSVITVNCTKNCFPFSEEPTKEEGSESHKQSAAGINS